MKNLGLLLFCALTCNAFDGMSRRIYAERYPAMFTAFLQHTNEKEVERSYITRFSKLLSNAHPDWLRKQPLIYDIGCGDGYLSSLVLEDLHTLIPGNLGYIGIDPQKELLEKTAQKIKPMPWLKPLFKAQKFEQILPDQEFYPVGDMILMIQCCYYMHSIPACIDIMKKLLSPNGYTFLIHVDDSALHLFKEQNKKTIESHSVDLLGAIEAALTKEGLHYTTSELPVTVTFPHLSDEAWQQLYNVPYSRYNLDYNSLGNDFMCMKNLFEFFFEHPLEAFLPKDKKILLDGFRKILIEKHHALTIYHRMHIVSLNALPE